MHPVASMKLSDRYTLTERLAVGGMGEVWKAHDDVLMRTVAIKILGQQFLQSPEFAARFRAEARHSASLAHPGVASIYDYAEEDKGSYLVMEFVAGEPLSTVLAHTPVPPMTTTLSILAQTADALAAAHAAGIIHRDVKPGNLMITPNRIVKVTDFGIARAADAIPLTAVGQVVGTPQYMSPEQASGGEIGPASDIYSLGVIGYEALAGCRPFVAATPLALAMAHVNSQPPALPDEVPVGVRDLIARAMAKAPDDRPKSAAEFAASLRAQQMQLTPPPIIDDGSLDAATLLDLVSSPTRHMPQGGVAVGAPKLVINDRSVTRAAGRRLPVAVTIAAVAAAIVLLVALARRDSGRTFGVSDTASTATGGATAPLDTSAAVLVATTPPPTAVVDPAVYLGQTVENVRKVLEALGFQVDAGTAHPGDLVVDVQPTGEVARGTTITVTVDSGKGDKGGGKGGGGKGG